MRQTAQDSGAAVVGVVALTGWTLLTLARGGLDFGTPGGGHASLVLALALVVGSALAVAALTLRPARWPTTARIGVAAIIGYVAWSAGSIAWALAPDLAWLATNRAAVAASALVIGFGVARAHARPLEAFVTGYTLAALPVLAWSVATRALPTLLGPGGETGRLAAPLSSPNALALVAVLAVPGGAALAARRGRWTAIGNAAMALSVAVVAFTQSRSGFAALGVMVVILLWFGTARAVTIASVAIAAVALVPAVAYAYTAPAFQGEFLLPPAATRVTAGLVLGMLVVVAVAVSVLVAPSLVAPARRLAAHARRGHRGRVALAVAAILVVVAGAVIVERSDVPIRSGPGRVLNADTNNRTEWWRQAWSATTDAPIVGEGAGAFPLIHLRERRVDEPRLITREPHQLTLEVTSELGLVGLLIALTGVGATLGAAHRIGRAATPAAAMLVVFLLQAQSDITWSTPAAFLPAMAAAGTVLGARSARPGSAPRGRTLTLAIGAPAVVLASLSAVTVWRADTHVVRAVELRDQAQLATLDGRSADWAGVLDAARAATEGNPLAIRGLLIEAQAERERGRPGAAMDAARRAIERQADNPRAWECLAAVAPVRDRASPVARMSRLDPARGRAEPLRCRPGS